MFERLKDCKSKEELQERLKLFPAEVRFTEVDDNRFCSWVNGHCFLWTLKGDEWDCEEL